MHFQLVSLLQHRSFAGPALCVAHLGRAVEIPHLRHVFAEQRVDALQVCSGQVAQLAATILCQLDRRARDVVRLSEGHA